jgi:hypothetical protein
VALSRCRTLEGIILSHPIHPGHVRLDYAVVKFLTQFQYDHANALFSVQDKIALLEDIIACK